MNAIRWKFPLHKQSLILKTSKNVENLRFLLNVTRFLITHFPYNAKSEIRKITENTLNLLESSKIPHAISTELKDWGRVFVLSENKRAGAYLLEISPSRSIPTHFHKIHEIEMILTSGLVLSGDAKTSGDVFEWPKYHIHTYENRLSSPAYILCVNRPSFREEYEIPAKTNILYPAIEKYDLTRLSYRDVQIKWWNGNQRVSYICFPSENKRRSADFIAIFVFSTSGKCMRQVQCEFGRWNEISTVIKRATEIKPTDLQYVAQCIRRGEAPQVTDVYCCISSEETEVLQLKSNFDMCEIARRISMELSFECMKAKFNYI